MAGRFILTILLIGALGGDFLLAGDKGEASSSGQKSAEKSGEAHAKWDGVLPKAFREKLERMSPSERERFLENWQKWQKMEDKDRQQIKSRAMKEQESIETAIDEAITKLGLQLGEGKRNAFAQRYREERRAIEHTLCKEMKAKREAMVNDLMAKLKDEFSGEKPVVVEKMEAIEEATVPVPATGSGGQ